MWRRLLDVWGILQLLGVLLVLGAGVALWLGTSVALAVTGGSVLGLSVWGEAVTAGRRGREHRR